VVVAAAGKRMPVSMRSTLDPGGCSSSAATNGRLTHDNSIKRKHWRVAAFADVFVLSGFQAVWKNLSDARGKL
jgi:hypothetical protein